VQRHGILPSSTQEHSQAGSLPLCPDDGLTSVTHHRESAPWRCCYEVPE